MRPELRFFLTRATHEGRSDKEAAAAAAAVFLPCFDTRLMTICTTGILPSTWLVSATEYQLAYAQTLYPSDR